MTTKPSRPAEREAWIINYLTVRQKAFASVRYAVDILSADFVWAYLEATNVKGELMMYGAPKCAMLASDLSRMFRKGLLDRWRTSLGEGAINQGFPPWTYCYYLPNWTPS